MLNFWYVARNYEILLDIDRPNTALSHAEARLRGAMQHRALHVRRVEYHASNSASHLHALITLDQDLHPIERATWAIAFHSDIYRACNNIMRALYEIPAPDLLITPIKFDRPPDDICACEYKHGGPIMESCDAADRLRGVDRVRSFFGRPESGEEIFKDDYIRYRRNFVWSGISPTDETLSRLRQADKIPPLS